MGPTKLEKQLCKLTTKSLEIWISTGKISVTQLRKLLALCDQTAKAAILAPLEALARFDSLATAGLPEHR